MQAHPWNVDFEWQRPTVAPRRLGEAEVEHFHATGYVVVDDLLAEDELAPLVAELDEIEAGVDALLQGLPDERAFIAESGAITFSPHAVLLSEAARAVSRHPAIVDLCHDLIGPDVRLYWDQLVYKKPEKPREFPWHQDNGYTFIEPQQYLTIWLALTDATVETGCPWVAPGVHRLGTLDHTYIDPLGYQCFPDHPDARAAPVRAGGAVVFSSLTPHRTGPNLSDGVRKAYILQYAPDGVDRLEGDVAASPAGRVRQDDAGRQYVVLRDGVRVG